MVEDKRERRRAAAEKRGAPDGFAVKEHAGVTEPREGADGDGSAEKSTVEPPQPAEDVR